MGYEKSKRQQTSGRQERERTRRRGEMNGGVRERLFLHGGSRLIRMRQSRVRSRRRTIIPDMSRCIAWEAARTNRSGRRICVLKDRPSCLGPRPIRTTTFFEDSHSRVDPHEGTRAPLAPKEGGFGIKTQYVSACPRRSAYGN